MWKKIIFGILVAVILASWPWSMVKNPAKFKLETIFYSASADEKWAFSKKVALDTSSIKKFYYNKMTIVKERYFKNFLVSIDLNNYFFAMHPREDVSGVDYRFKYPWWTIIFLVLGIKVAVRNKKIKKIGIIFLVEILLLSFLKYMDGWDLILYFPISWLMILGAKEIL
jgi:hypothetical protein